MSTEEKFSGQPTVVSSVTLRPATLQRPSVTVTTTITDVLSTSPLVPAAGRLVTSVVIRVDGDEAIRQANEALSGIERPKEVDTRPSR